MVFDPLLGYTIRDRRQALRLTQTALANLHKTTFPGSSFVLTQNIVSALELDKLRPGPELAQQLNQIFARLEVES